MPIYRKKPVIINAWRFTDADAKGNEFVCQYGDTIHRFLVETDNSRRRVIRIKTLEGVMTANPEDWIIRGVAGEFYPCKHDIFLKTYEPV